MKNAVESYLALKRPTADERFQFRKFLFSNANQVQNGDFLKSTSFLKNDVSFKHSFELDGRPIIHEEWMKDEKYEEKNYDLKNGHIFYRGTFFQNGDILLCNRNRLHDGIFTTLVEGRQDFSHVAMFINLNKDGKRFPAIIEMHFQGIRAIPLNIFLTKHFSKYIEIFRSQLLTDTHFTNLSDIAFKMLKENSAFDVFIDDTQSKFFTCARLASEILFQVGSTRVEPKSKYSIKTLNNLKKLGIENCAHRHLLMPDDYSKDENFYLIGAIDNGYFLEMNMIALMREKIQEIWQGHILNSKKFPISFYFYKLMIGLTRNKFIFSSFLARPLGLTAHSFPNGPMTFLALTPKAVENMEKGVNFLIKNMDSYVVKLFLNKDWSEIKTERKICQHVNEAGRFFQLIFD